MTGPRWLSRLDRRARVAVLGALAVLVAVVATAIAIGGAPGASGPARSASARPAASGLSPAVPPQVANHGRVVAAPSVAAAGVPALPEPLLAARSASGVSSAGGSGTTTALSKQSAVTSSSSSSDGSSLAATKIVRTGTLTLRISKDRVQGVVGQLGALATAQGGYVASSNSTTGGGEPSGAVVLRIPVANFDAAVSAAEKLGHVLSLNTSAQDVTGHYVDLAAKKRALVRTRATYLSILSRARTIGATLAVQERIEDVQQQIDELHGQLSVLSHQAAYSTLTVDVTPVALVTPVHHPRGGIAKAWHTSWSRFARGIDAIVGAIGPIVLALLILAALAGIAVAGYRGVRRATS